MDVLFILAVFILVVQGVLFWVYNTFRDICLNNAGQYVPHATATLFATTFAYGIGLGIAVVAAMATLSCFGCPFYIAAVFYGIHAPWSEVVTKDFKSEREERRKVLLKFPVPKLQFRILDLLTAAFSFGLILTILTNFVLRSERMKPYFLRDAVPFAAGILMAETIAFFVAMDVFRRSETLQRPLPRALYLMAVLLLGSIPPVFIILILSWYIWQYSVWKVQVYR